MSTAMIVSRALELGLSLSDLDIVDVGFIIELAEQRNDDVNVNDEIEATPEMLDKFFC